MSDWDSERFGNTVLRGVPCCIMDTHEDFNARIGATIKNSLREKIIDMALEQHRTFSNMVEVLLEKAVKSEITTVKPIHE